MVSPQPLIAIVDDDERLLESLGDFFESTGHSVLLFSSARALLEEASLSEIDCLISDIGMPEMDGYELKKRANEICPGLPVILMTGRYGLLDKAQPSEGVHVSAFRKPFDSQMLLSVVTEALGSRA